MTTTLTGDREEYEQLLAGFRTALLTTRGPDGHYHSRPMAVRPEGGKARVLYTMAKQALTGQRVEPGEKRVLE